MSSLTVFDELVLHSLVGDLPMGWLHRLATYGGAVVRPAGYRLYLQGESPQRFWLLRSGIVALDLCLPRGGDFVIDRVGADGVVGSWLVPPHRCPTGAVVTDEIHAIEFGAAGVRNLIGEDPALGLELTARLAVVLAGRLRQSYRLLAELNTDPDGRKRQHGRTGPEAAGPPALF